MQTLQTSLLVDGLTFGEGPRWHDGRLWFTDGPTGTVKSVDDAGRIAVEAEVEHPSGLGWLPDGTMVTCTLRAAKIMRVDRGEVRVTHDLSDLAWSTNDLVVSREGRIYVDLYTRTETGIAGEIGLVTPDGSTLVVSETRGSRLLAFTIDPDGSLGDKRVYAECCWSDAMWVNSTPPSVIDSASQ